MKNIFGLTSIIRSILSVLRSAAPTTAVAAVSRNKRLSTARTRETTRATTAGRWELILLTSLASPLIIHQTDPKCDVGIGREAQRETISWQNVSLHQRGDQATEYGNGICFSRTFFLLPLLYICSISFFFIFSFLLFSSIISVFFLTSLREYSYHRHHRNQSWPWSSFSVISTALSPTPPKSTPGWRVMLLWSPGTKEPWRFSFPILFNNVFQFPLP